MKKYFFIFFILINYNIILSQIVNIPDSTFKDYLLHSYCVDTNGDGYADEDADLNNDGEIQISEAEAIIYIDVDNKGIKSLEGINSFKNIKTIKCQRNRIKEINITGKAMLETLQISPNTFLEKVIVTNNPLLTELSVQRLKNLKYLDCSHNSLKKFKIETDYFNSKDIDKIDCSYNKISYFQTGGNILLDTLICSHNNIKEYVPLFHSYSKIKYIDVSYNEISKISHSELHIQELKFDHNPLKYLRIPIFKQDMSISGYDQLEEIIIENVSHHIKGKHKTLKISDNKNLKKSWVFLYDICDVYLSNIPDHIGFISTKNSNLVVENMREFSKIRVYSKYVYIKNCPEMENLNSYFSDSKLYIEDMPKLKNITISLLSNENDTLSGIIRLNNLPVLDTFLIKNSGEHNNNGYDSISLVSLPSLKYFKVIYPFYIKDLKLFDLPSLNTLDLELYVRKLSLQNLPELENVRLLNAPLETLELDNLDKLKFLKISSIKLKKLLLENLPQLRHLIYELGMFSFTQANPIDTVLFKHLPRLDSIILINPEIKAFVLKDLPNFKTFKSYKGYPSVEYHPLPVDYKFTDLPSLENVYLSEMNVRSLLFENLPELETIRYYENTGLDSIGFSNLAIKQLYFKNSRVPMRYLKISDLPNIDYIECNFRSQYYPLELKNLQSLDSINLSGGVFSGPLKLDMEFSDYPELKKIYTRALLVDSFSVHNLPKLKTIQIKGNKINNLMIYNLPKLEELLCNGIGADYYVNSTIYNVPLLSKVLFINVNFKNIDLSHINNLSYLDCSKYNSQRKISYLNLKNCNPFLSYFAGEISHICVDNEEEINLLKELNPLASNSTFTEYCTIPPCADYSTMEGAILLKTENDDCDTTNNYSQKTKLKISYGQESIISSNNKYKYYTHHINEDIKIIPSNETDYYNYQPESEVIKFDSFNQTYITDFCMVPNGVHNDLEIAIIPVSTARPGFNVEYIIQYKNTGTSGLSGYIVFKYNKDKLKYVSSIPTETLASDGELKWEFNNLKPMEENKIKVILRLGLPVNNPPVREGDILEYEAVSILNEIDENPENNTFTLYQEISNDIKTVKIINLNNNAIDVTNSLDYIYYLIKFENNKSDTVHQVVIKDIIDTSKLDINSLIPIFGSYDFYTKIHSGNIVDFVFENVNFKDDAYLSFKIKPLNTLNNGDIICNSTAVYFDSLAPILTNIDTITVEKTSSIPNIFSENKNVILLPNPSNGHFKIISNKPFSFVEIFNSSGQKILKTTDKIIDLRNYKKSMYFIRIFFKDSIVTKKLLLQ